MEATQRLPNIVLLPPPVYLGHLIPFIELANKLVSDHNCTVTLVIPHDGSPDMKRPKHLLQGIPKRITPVFLPPVPTEDLPQNATAEVVVSARVMRLLPSLRQTLSRLRDLGTPPAALVVDFFTSYAIDVAREFGLPAYVYSIFSANSMSLFMDLARMKPRDHVTSDPIVLPDCLPGSIKLRPDDYLDSMKDTESEGFTKFVDLCKKQRSADGILVNSFHDLESQAFEYLGKLCPPVHPVGPLIRTEPSDKVSSDCLEWLDRQPRESVFYVCFGSGGSLSKEQMNELAIGLEMSEQRFVWVVTRPQEDAAAAYFDKSKRSDDGDDLDFLPRGFLERTKGRGLVVGSWVPQVRVLSHGSTGGFLTHCGWNSILESAVLGVPLVAWPLCHEQKVNAVFLTDVMKAAIRVKTNENEIVEREHISFAVKEVMEGEEGKRIRKRMKDVKIEAVKALMEDGSSTQALAKVVKKWGVK